VESDLLEAGYGSKAGVAKDEGAGRSGQALGGLAQVDDVVVGIPDEVDDRAESTHDVSLSASPTLSDERRQYHVGRRKETA
jgi:hypothetical protein